MSEEMIFEGECMYANLPPRPAQKGFESDDTSYSVQMPCSKELYNDLMKKKLPALTKLHEHNGKTYIKLKASKIKHARDGQVFEFNDIPVTDLNQNTIKDSIANGSVLKCLVSLEDLKGRTGKVMRLKAVVVEKLIKYDFQTELLNKLGAERNSKTIEEQSDVASEPGDIDWSDV